jgi:hypothetical protein
LKGQWLLAAMLECMCLEKLTESLLMVHYCYKKSERVSDDDYFETSVTLLDGLLLVHDWNETLETPLDGVLLVHDWNETLETLSDVLLLVYYYCEKSETL